MPSTIRIPFNKPCRTGREAEYLGNAVLKGHLSGDGPYTRLCKETLESLLPKSKILLTTSCTHALEMAALLLDIQPGDEVIVPSFTFVSTANAFALRGAKIIFADIRRDTLNLNEALISALITPRTKAIVPVHYAGVSCEMDIINSLARSRGIAVVEDNAHGLFASYRGRPCGTLGSLATQSFHETKNITCGEGGALVINEMSLLERAEIIREKGTNRSRFFRGQIDKYSWVDIGSSYLPSDLLAAYLYAQLENYASIQQKRKDVWMMYNSELASWARLNDVRLPFVPEHCEQAYHMFYMIMPSLDQRQRFIGYLKERGILSVFHYLPLHLSTYGQRFGNVPGDCPVTEDLSDRLVRLPFFYSLTKEEQSEVVETILSFTA